MRNKVVDFVVLIEGVLSILIVTALKMLKESVRGAYKPCTSNNL